MMPEEIKQEIRGLPKPPTVTPDGRPTTIDDYDSFMQFLMLATIASNTRKTAKTTQALYDHAMDLVGQGLTRLMELTITEKLQKRLLPEPWSSVSITNDGDPNDVEAEPTVYVRFQNLYTDEIPVGLGETLNNDFKTPKLKRLYFRTGSGETAKIRIVGSY